MDNIFEIIVFFFVIYSILGSIFGKKKPKKTNIPSEPMKPQTIYKRQDDNKVVLKKSQNNQDILEELFGIKLPKTDNDYENHNVEKTSPDLEHSTWDPQKEFEQKVLTREKYEYRNIEKVIPDIDYDHQNSLEISKKKIKTAITNHYEYKVISFEKARKIKEKLADKESIKELFVISEIIGKPKALRKN